MDPMNSVSEVLNKLRKEGYTIDFNLANNCLTCAGSSLRIYPDDFVVDRHYRFEGLSDPADEAIVYAISSARHQVKGTLVDGYGIYSDGITHELVKALKSKISSDPEEKKGSVIVEKFNEATPLRPEGDRPLDAPLVQMDLLSFTEQIKKEQTWKNSDRNAITIFKTAGMRMVLIALHQGAEMKTHTAPGIISVQVLEGHIRFTTERHAAEMSKGQMLALHAGIPHSIVATEEAVFLLSLAITP